MAMVTNDYNWVLTSPFILYTALDMFRQVVGEWCYTTAQTTCLIALCPPLPRSCQVLRL